MDCTSNDIVDLRLRVPSNTFIFGPTRSGKTHVTCEMIKQRDKLFDKKFFKVVYLYTYWQNLYEELSKDEDIIFTTDVEEIDKHTGTGAPILFVWDDQILNIMSSPRVLQEIITQKSHHMNLALIVLSQSLFIERQRLSLLNIDYALLLKFSRDRNMVYTWLRQSDSSLAKQLFQVYRQVTDSKPYSHFFVSFHNSDPDIIRYRSSVFPSSDLILFGANGNHSKRV